jgi:hypothetical protein
MRAGQGLLVSAARGQPRSLSSLLDRRQDTHDAGDRRRSFEGRCLGGRSFLPFLLSLTLEESVPSRRFAPVAGCASTRPANVNPTLQVFGVAQGQTCPRRLAMAGDRKPARVTCAVARDGLRPSRGCPCRFPNERRHPGQGRSQKARATQQTCSLPKNRGALSSRSPFAAGWGHVSKWIRVERQVGIAGARREKEVRMRWACRQVQKAGLSRSRPPAQPNPPYRGSLCSVRPASGPRTRQKRPESDCVPPQSYNTR